MLEQLYCRGAFGRVALEALLQEVDALVTELVPRGELRRVALGDVVHDSPFVV
jgi:hypothetical protein